MKYLIWGSILLIIIIASFFSFKLFSKDKLTAKSATIPPKTSSSPIPSPTTPPPEFDYTLVFVGDSFTEVLGNFDEIKSYLSKYYPDKSFLLLNYGYGSTNILSVKERLETWTDHGRPFQPIQNIDYDLIFLESFGHNPLSQFPLAEGLKKQNEALDDIVSIITQKQPKKKASLCGHHCS